MFAAFVFLVSESVGFSAATEDASKLLIVKGGEDDARDLECKASREEDDEMTLMQMTLMQMTSAMRTGQSNWDSPLGQGAQGKFDATAAVQRQSMPGYDSRHVSLSEATLPEQTSPDAASTGDSIRPHAGSGPETVSFGVYAKGVYHISMHDETFTIDFVTTFRWHDIRAAKLLPPGQLSLTFPETVVKDSLWLPDIAITNHKIDGYELISSSVIVNSSGVVTMVQRGLSEIRAHYNLEAFPWDTQVLEARLASTIYMLNDVKLVPLKEAEFSGVSESCFSGGAFSLLSYEISEREEVDGMLRKSRGIIRFTVKRGSSMYIHDHLTPSVFLLIMSWCCFVLPFDVAYCMPRLMLSCVTLLSFTTLSSKMSATLPPGAPLSWNDAWNQNCQYLMFIVICLNAFTEVVMHTLKRWDLALRIHDECRWLWLLAFGVTCFFLITFKGSAKSERLCLIVEEVSLVISISYAVRCCVSIYSTSPDAHGVFGKLHTLKTTQDDCSPLRHEVG